MKKFLVAMAATALPVLSFAGENGVAQSTFEVSAKVDPYCKITTQASDVSLSYNPFDSDPTTGNTSLKFQCVKGTEYTIEVDTNGKLVNTEDENEVLNFTATADSLGGIETNGLGTDNTLNIALVLNNGQNVKVGTYRGSVTVNISY